jgi:hypothetical protein
MRKRVATIRVVMGFAMMAASADPLIAQTTPPASSSAQAPETRWFVRDWTRIESWSYFEPKPGGGNPNYTDVANRLLFGVERRTRHLDLAGALQYVQFAWLPPDAVGPGALGSGALYFQHSGRTDSHGIYVRNLTIRLKAPDAGLSVQLGRFGYTSGAESPSGDPKIEVVKRQRVDSRLIGEFEWSLYQRAFDGARVDVDKPGWHATGSALRPTQGGFEESAGVEIRRIDLLTGAASLKPGLLLPHTDWQVFANRYDDTRDVQARPDNTNKPAGAVDAHINTFGTSAVGVYPTGSGQIDVMGWAAGQTGSWYGQDHRAWAAAAEVGYQWAAVSWRPWLRGGFFRGSGDQDPSDSTHGTFFPVMPTIRKYSLSTVYSLMNLNDVFVQALLRPNAATNIRVDLHRLDLASAADRWYAGSGATQETGTYFGYAGRLSNGATALGTMLEGSAEHTFSQRFSVNGYAGVMWGGDVVERLFAGRRLAFVYAESVLQFGR